MANITSNPANGVAWDLQDLYKRIDDPQINKDKVHILDIVAKFTDKYRDKINTVELIANDLIVALQEFEELLSQITVLAVYANLLFAKDKNNQQVKQFYQSIEEYNTELSNKLIWFDLEIAAIPDSKFSQLISDTNLLESYGYYLNQLRKFRPHLLSESEEKILNEKSQTSGSAFVRLFDELSANQKFILKYQGKKIEIDEASIKSILNYDLDRKKRKAAADAYSESCNNNAHLYTYILNTLLLDRKINRNLRKYEYPAHSAYLGNDTAKEVVDSLKSAIVSNWNINEKYYVYKRKLMGVTKLYEWDRYNSIYTGEKVSVTWEEAQSIVLKAFAKFSSEFSDIAKLFFDNKWIDAELASGKSTGAFCAYSIPKKHPYILVNFTGSARDVMVLAHELGHGIHQYLASQQTFLNYHSVTPVAEIASVFGETLVFDSLLDKITNVEERRALLANNLEEKFATVFRQICFHMFEEQVNIARDKEGELSTERINEIWQTTVQQMFGKGLTLSENHRTWWMPILHFYHYNFYVYSYAFGELLSLAIYSQYKQTKDVAKFKQDYMDVLRTGGSKSPVDLMKMLGFNIEDPAFWTDGMKILDSYVDKFAELV